MKKSLNILFIFMLITQSMFSSVAFNNTVSAEGANKDIDTDISYVDEDEREVDIDEYEGNVSVQIDWSVESENIEAGDKVDIALLISEQVHLQDNQSGELEFQGDNIATYRADAAGNVMIEFMQELEVVKAGLLEGTFLLKGKVEAETTEKLEESPAENGKEYSKPAETEEADETSNSDENGSEEQDEKVKDEEKEENAEQPLKKETKEKASENKLTMQKSLADAEKHGFTLELSNAKDLDGKPFDDDHQLELADEFYLDLAWNLADGHNYEDGDVETFQLPHGIKIQEEFEIELKLDGLDVAKATIKTDGTVELTFTDFVETHSKVKGHMQIVSMIDEENAEVDDGDIVLTPIGDEGEIRIPIDLGDREKTIEKKGTPNKGYNADKINWEVIINKHKNNLTNAMVTDVLPEGTEFKEGSLKVTKLDVDLHGNIKGDLGEIEISGDSVEDGTLNIPLGNIKDAYRIEYVTNVTDDEQKKFKNNATLTDEDLEDVSANATATINRGNPLNKSKGKYNAETRTISWDVEFNYNGKNLTDVDFTDSWTPKGKLNLVEDSLKFQEMTIDENGKPTPKGEATSEVPGGGTVESITDGFNVKGISTDKPYKITYETKLKDRVIDTTKIKNTAKFGEESATGNTSIGQMVGVKSLKNIDYSAKTINWEIRINRDKQLMKNISIVDTLGKGLTLKQNTVKVTVGGTEYNDFEITGDNPFTINFPEGYETDQEIKVIYTSIYKADELPKEKHAENTANIKWTDENGNNQEKEVTDGKDLNTQTEDNSWKNGSYNPDTKEITWTIFTNYRENSFDNLIVKDKPQGNQQIVEDSAVVKELKIASNGNISEGNTLKNISTIDTDDNTLEVTIGKTNKAYKIEYKTSLKGLSDIQKEYVNEAKVFDGNELLSEIDAKVGIAKAHTYGAKSGKQEGKQVHWAVTVNPGQQKVKNLKLEDTVSDNQDILGDTFKVYEADVDGKGNATKKDEPILSDKYELTHEVGDSTFTIEWNDTVERAFVVEYSTLFFAGHNEDVTNSYDITGDNIVDGGTTDGSGSVKIKQFGSGSGEGTAGYLVVDKVDTTYGQEKMKLAGAQFDLIDADTGNILKSGTTDEEGQIDFGRLLFGNYKLKETTVPEGYVTPEETQTITIDKAYDSSKNKADYLYEVENYIPVFAVELSKTGKDNQALKGAKFTLFDSDDNELQTKETDKNGKILFEDIENAGDYYVQETQAPAGYVLNEEKYEVIIDKNQHEPVKVFVENKERGAVQLTKTDQDTDEALQGVDFVLQKENDSGGYDTIKTYTTDENGQIKTTNTLEAGNYQFVEKEGLDGYRTNGKPVKFTVKVNSTKTQKLTMTNEQYKGSIKLIKIDAATNELLEGAEFKLIDSDEEVVKKNLSTNTDGEVIVDDLFLGNYQLIETKAPEGYELDETPIDIEITEDKEVVEKTMTNNKITNITVNKEWINDGEDIESVTIKLLPTEETVELNDNNNWETTFEELYVYDEAGKKIDYQVEELAVDGYNSKVTGDAEKGFTVTNTTTTSVTGEKTWKDDDSDERPDQITVKLLANGEKLRQTKVTAKDDWKYEFAGLNKYDENGEEITYTIDEVEVDGYDTNIDGFNIENVRVGTISVQGEKTWQDENAADRPEEITVDLLREINGKRDEEFSKSQTVQPDKNGDWTYEFADLEEYNEEGIAYTYLVKEADVPDKYKSDVQDHDIVNIRTGKTEVTGIKRWKDDTLKDRPESITVNLLRNEVVIDSKEVTEAEDWNYTFTELEKYNDQGQLYEYSVSEQEVPGYESKVNGTDITNTRSDTKDIEVTKAWLDDNSKERPDSVIVYLKQNDNIFDTVELKASNDWKYTFENLEAFDENGHAYSYAVEEQAVKGYETSIDGFDITNLRVGETEVTGTKTWLDDNSPDRPEEITVNLVANGEQTDQKMTVDALSDWTYAFTKLDKYDQEGNKIEYTVDEEEIAGYEKSLNGNDITNLRVGKTEITGEKIWEEVDERYRPDYITVHLLANGDKINSTEVNKNTDWSYVFTGLNKYDQEGKEIVYTIEESDTPKGYESKSDGYNVINTQKTTEVSGEKIWVEQESEYRPEQIKVQLLANGEPEETKVLSKNNWTYEFTDLAKYNKDGAEIQYTVKELNVPEAYESEVDGFNIINTQKLTEVSGEKRWNEVDERYRPDAVKVQLLANGQVKDDVFMSKESDWKYEFVNLAKSDQNGDKINYTIEEVDIPTGYDSEVDGYDIINTQKSTKVTVKKEWKEVDETYRPDNVTFKLLADGKEIESKEVSAEDDWIHEFTELPKYNKEGKIIEYTVDEKDVPGYEKAIDGTTITNTQLETEVPVTKTWQDDHSNDRPDEITVQVNDGNRVVQEKTLSAEDHQVTSNKWEYVFTGLALYNQDGEEIEYTVTEDKINGYKTTINKFDITNTRTGTTEKTIKKAWKDENKEDRPDSITINLLQNEEVLKEYEIKAEDGWELSIEELPKYDNKGVAYEYAITEHDVAGYASEVEDFDITNTRTDDKNIEITKTWLDNKDSEKRPAEIEVELFRTTSDSDKEFVDTYKMTGETDAKIWSLEIEKLPTYDAKGKAYTYSIAEKPVDGYESKVNGFNITNLRSDHTAVTGEKTWLDGDSEDRPDSITVELFANGKFVDDIDVTSQSDWKYEFTQLPKFDREGKEIKYTIDEKSVKGYLTSINNTNITNTKLTEVKGIKTWENDNPTDRPDAIIVKLLQNGKELDSIKVTAKDDWQYAFTNLLAYDENNEAYSYTVEEVAVNGYEAKVDGYDITNTWIEEESVETGTTTPTTPEKNKDSTQPSSKDEDQDRTGFLPKTATGTFNLILIGTLLLIIGAGIITFRRKRV